MTEKPPHSDEESEPVPRPPRTLTIFCAPDVNYGTAIFIGFGLLMLGGFVLLSIKSQMLGIAFVIFIAFWRIDYHLRSLRVAHYNIQNQIHGSNIIDRDGDPTGPLEGKPVTDVPYAQYVAVAVLGAMILLILLMCSGLART